MCVESKVFCCHPHPVINEDLKTCGPRRGWNCSPIVGWVAKNVVIIFWGTGQSFADLARDIEDLVVAGSGFNDFGGVVGESADFVATGRDLLGVGDTL